MRIMSGLNMCQVIWGMKQATRMVYLGPHRFHHRDVRLQAFEHHTKFRKAGHLNTATSHQTGLATTVAPQVASYKIHKEHLAGELIGILAVLFTHRNHVQKIVLTFSMYK
jgi:hypothetical protein